MTEHYQHCPKSRTVDPDQRADAHNQLDELFQYGRVLLVPHCCADAIGKLVLQMQLSRLLLAVRGIAPTRN